LPSNDRGKFTYRHTDWWEGFMEFAVEMGLGAMIFIPSYVKIGSGIEKLIGGHRQHGDLISLRLYFQNKESRLKIGFSFEVMMVVTVQVVVLWEATR
jgi:hypothetical protein